VPSCAVYGGLQPFAASELIALHRNVLDPLNAGACGAMTGRCSSDGTRAHSLTHARAATDTSALPCHACDDACCSVAQCRRPLEPACPWACLCVQATLR
jgi:hypothetical protein